jgi:membrane protein required for colicin V production
MEGFTIFDGVVAGVILISAVLAYSRGFVREAMSIAGWIVGRFRRLHLRSPMSCR